MYIKICSISKFSLHILINIHFDKIILLIILLLITSSIHASQQSDYKDNVNIYNNAIEEMKKDNYQIAFILFEKSLQYFKSLEDLGFYVYTLNYQANCDLSLNNLKRGQVKLDSLYKLINDHTEIICDAYLISDYYYLSAEYNFKYGNAELCLFNLNKSLHYHQLGEGNSYGLFNIQRLSGYCEYILGDYDKSILSFDSALTNAAKEVTNNMKSTWVSTQGMCYLHKKDIQLSRIFISKAKSLLNTDEHYKNSYFIGYYLEDLSEYQIKTNSFIEAQENLDSILNLDPLAHELLNYYQNSGILQLKLNNFKEAESYFLKGIELCSDTFSFNKYKHAETFHLTSQAYFSVDKLSESLRFNEDCLNTLIPEYSLTINIDPSKSLNHKYTIEALLLRAKILSKQGKYNKAKKAIDDSQLYLDYMLNKTLISQGSRHFFINKLKIDYEKIIQIALQNNDPNFAFEISQKIHGNLLSLELFKYKAAEHFNIPLEYTDYEQSLKVRISTKESELSRIDYDIEPEKYDSSDNNINYFKGELNNLIKSMEYKFPAYYKLKYSSPENYSVDEIQKQTLNSSSALLEYFLGEDTIYTFAITKKDMAVFKQPIDSTLVQNINQLNGSIRSLQSDFTDFTASSTYLYETLLQEPLDYLGPSINKLYIIPDNEISYVPFEVLINEVPEDARRSRYDLLPYLVNNFSVSYHYSSALLDQDDTSLTDNITGFAPSFTSSFSSSENLESLLFNKEEVLIVY